MMTKQGEQDVSPDEPCDMLSSVNGSAAWASAAGTVPAAGVILPRTQSKSQILSPYFASGALRLAGLGIFTRWCQRIAGYTFALPPTTIRTLHWLS